MTVLCIFFIVLLLYTVNEVIIMIRSALTNFVENVTRHLIIL